MANEQIKQELVKTLQTIKLLRFAQCACVVIAAFLVYQVLDDRMPVENIKQVDTPDTVYSSGLQGNCYVDISRVDEYLECTRPETTGGSRKSNTPRMTYDKPQFFCLATDVNGNDLILYLEGEGFGLKQGSNGELEQIDDETLADFGLAIGRIDPPVRLYGSVIAPGNIPQQFVKLDTGNSFSSNQVLRTIDISNANEETVSKLATFHEDLMDEISAYPIIHVGVFIEETEEGFGPGVFAIAGAIALCVLAGLCYLAERKKRKANFSTIAKNAR